MKGTWKGYYRHNTPYMQKEAGFDKTGFTIEITSFDGKKFSGIVNDDISTGGMPETGKITGHVNGNSIAFEKRMPVRTMVHPELGRMRENNKMHPTLYYSGTITNNGEFKGDWKFRIKIGFLFGLIPIPYSPGKGTWSMEKVD